MENLKWVYSTNDERWSPEEEFETKEQAIAAGKSDNDCIDKGIFWVGQQRNIDKSFLLENCRMFDLEDFNQTVAEEAGGDDDFAPESDNDDNLEKLNDLIAGFIINNFNTTMGWTIYNVEEILL